MDVLKVILIGFFGVVVGAVLGFIIPLLVCYAYDAITNPAPGSGLMTVGWVFCFITIPIGAICGGILSVKKLKTKTIDTEVK